MRIACRSVSSFGAIVLLALCASAWFASKGYAQNIGSTAEAHNNVSGEVSGAANPLKAGDAVFRNEFVRTGEASTAKLVFLDSTNLAVGPISRVKLDQFVYSGEFSTQKMTVNLAKGVFRFTTGALDKKAYDIETPTASIGVRGTVIDIAAAAAKTNVTLIEGVAIVCAKGGGHCVVLNQAGQTASARRTASGAIQTALVSTPVNVGALCAGSLCAPTAYASLSLPGAGGVATLSGGFPAGLLCGH